MTLLPSLVAALLLAGAPADKPSTKKADAKPAAKAAAKAEKVAEPEYVGIPHRVSPASGALEPLERQTYAMRTKVKGLGFGGARASFEVPGTTSPVRFPGGAQRFVIRVASREADPSTIFKLVPLGAAAAGKKEAKQGSAGSRQMVWVDQHGAFSQAQVDPNLGALPLLVKPLGDSSFEFKPESDLAPGEYAVLLPASMTAFCFGIDAAAK